MWANDRQLLSCVLSDVIKQNGSIHVQIKPNRVWQLCHPGQELRAWVVFTVWICDPLQQQKKHLFKLQCTGDWYLCAGAEWCDAVELMITVVLLASWAVLTLTWGTITDNRAKQYIWGKLFNPQSSKSTNNIIITCMCTSMHSTMALKLGSAKKKSRLCETNLWNTENVHDCFHISMIHVWLSDVGAAT